MSRCETTIRLTNAHGLHARPATKFVQLASQFQSSVQVVKDGVAVDGKSVASMLTLGAEHGTQLRIRARGDDAHQAVEKLRALIADNFGEA